MFKRSIIICVSILFLLITTFANADPSKLYPHMSLQDLEQYEYTIEEYGPDYMLVEIEGKWYYVEI